ncbi:MAG: HAD-IA family hydrolase, partial [Planctomycetota bacterium]|nr:HAD-IA family hydrolase [Planctomycetota bacterium]
MHNAPLLDVIFLDIDDTLFATTDFVSVARRDALTAMIERGLRADLDFLLAELEAVVSEFGSNHDHHYDFLLKRLPPKITDGLNHELLVVAGVIAYHNAKWQHLHIKDADLHLLSDLSTAGVKLGVISSGLLRKQTEKILRLGIDRYIDHQLIFITHGVGISKDNPQLYLSAIQASGCEPCRIMHVGDHPFHDIDMANEAGMKTVWVNGGGKHSVNSPNTTPNHVITSFAELRQ